MSKNIGHIQHVKSNVVENGSPKLPQPSVLVEGELAINYASGFETISIKNASGDIVPFSSDEIILSKVNEVEIGETQPSSGSPVEIWIDTTENPDVLNVYTKSETDTLLLDKLDITAFESKLGSGFTGDNSAKTVTDYITELEGENLWEASSGANSAVLKNSSGTASGDFAVAEGKKTIASGSSSHAEGLDTKAGGYASHAEGHGTKAGGYASHAEGGYTTASGSSSHAEGYSTTAKGSYSHAEGGYTTANGDYSHAEGYWTQARGSYSHAEGTGTTASGQYSHAEGSGTTASGDSSHAEGYQTSANAHISHAEGWGTITNNISEHASGQFNVSSKGEGMVFGSSGSTLFSVGNGTADDNRHNAFEIRQNGDIYIVSGNSDIRLQDYIGGGGSITVDQVLDDTTSASTNPVSSKAVYKAVTDNELVWTNAFVAISGAISSHTEDTSIHVTSADKANWNAKLDASDIADFFDDAKYEDSGTTKVINFYHGNTIKATIDASDFIADGMVDDVRIENGNLVIDFNTASGKQDISIPLTSIFDPSNYYNKTEINNLVGSGFTVSSITEVIESNERVIASSLNDLNTRKLDASAYTPTDLSNYYTKSETSGATELQTAFGNKANTATTLAGYGITDVYTKSQTSGATELTTEFAKYYTTAQTSGATELETAFNGKTDTATTTALNNVVTAHTADSTSHLTSTEKSQLHTHSNKTYLDDITGSVGTMAYENASSYSSATQVSTALNSKVDTTAFTNHTGSSVHMTSTEKTNLDSLATNIAAISGITSTKVSNWDGAATNSHTHSNKSTLDAITASSTAINSLTGAVGTMAFQNTSSYSSATQVNTALAGKSNTNHTHYWANLQVGSAANYITEPEIKSVKINGSTSNAASSNNCHIQYDTTNKCLKFIFN